MTFLARLVLAGFLLSLGVAVASPVVKPRALEMVCSGGSYKLVAGDEAGTGESPSALDCPLCVTAGLPPALLATSATAVWGQGALPWGPSLPPAADLADGPPPARAPPCAQAFA